MVAVPLLLLLLQLRLLLKLLHRCTPLSQVGLLKEIDAAGSALSHGLGLGFDAAEQNGPNFLRGVLMGTASFPSQHVARSQPTIMPSHEYIEVI